MQRIVFRGAALMAALLLSGCEKKSVLDVAAENMSVAGTSSVKFVGNGIWGMIGQQFSNSGPWAQIPVSNYTMTIDYIAGASHVQMTRTEPSEADTPQNLTFDREYFRGLGPNADEYVSGNSVWNVTSTNPAASPNAMQPNALAERTAMALSTPHGFIKLARVHKASVRETSRGHESNFSVGNQRFYGRFNKMGDLELIQTWIDHPVLGDMLIETQFDSYTMFGNVRFPSRISRMVGGHPALSLTVTDVKTNIPADVLVPDEVKNYRAPEIKVLEELLAPGVWHLRGGSHHSLLIEQADHLIVVEAPQSEARSAAVIARAKELAPNKAIRFVINTHTHVDHSAGLRAYVAEGATVVTHAANEDYYNKAWANPRTISPDAMALNKIHAKIQPVAEKFILSDGTRSVELHAMHGLNHTDAMLMVYLPTEKIVSIADVYTPASASASKPSAPIPGAVSLLENMERVGIEGVKKIAGLHGSRIGTMDDLLLDAGGIQPVTDKRK